jgi:hypothetical protein
VISLNNELLVRSLVAMPNSLSITEFQNLCDITSRTTAKELLRYLVNSGIGKISGDSVTFTQRDKLDAIILALTKGVDTQELSKNIRWRDFEIFASILIDSSGYTCERNVVLSKPRLQIDVIGFYRKIALLIDCKHWMKIYDSNIAKFSFGQIRRAKIFLDKREDMDAAIPIILTLHEHRFNFFEKVPIVPISKFREFLQNFPFYLDRLYLIQRE